MPAGLEIHIIADNYAIEADIRAWIDNWNENPRPFIWTKTADEILESLGRLLLRTSGAGH